MRLDLPAAPARRDRTPRRVSDCLWSWDARDTSLVSDQGVPGVFTRAATLASVVDRNGTTYTAPHSMPAWEMRDVDGDGVREAIGLRMGADDRLTWPFALPPQTLSGLLEIVYTTSLTSTQTLFAIEGPLDPSVSGNALWLDYSGTAWRLNYRNSLIRTATLASTPSVGDRIRLRWILASNGRITLYESRNGAGETSATADPLALPAAWADGATLRLNSRGNSSRGGAGWYRRAKVMAGVQDVDVIDAAR